MRRYLVVLVWMWALPTFAEPKQILKKGTPNPGHYIILFNPEFAGDAARELAQELALRHRGATRHVFADPPGMVVRMERQAVEALINDPRISQVEEEGVARPALEQSNAPWHLDRLDQHSSTLDGKFICCTGGMNVLAYVVDSGVRASHREFRWTDTNTASRVEAGHEVFDWPGTADNPCPATGYCSPDPSCTNAGHGTAVASVLGGHDYGAAKSVTIVPVRVMGCTSRSFEGDVMKGIEWVRSDFVARRADPTRARPAVVNLSYEVDVPDDLPPTSLEIAIDKLINENVPVVVAAGNMNRDVRNTSPARRSFQRGGRVITVAGSSPGDKRWICGQDSGDDPCGTYVVGSNWGGVDIFAPARLVKSAGITSDTATRQSGRSGTSFSAPLVAARAARVLEDSVPGAYDAYWVYTRVIEDPSLMIDAPAAPLNGSPARLLFHPIGFSRYCYY